MIYLLDTNICIYIINQKPPHVLERFRREKLGDIALSSVTASELTFGVVKSGTEKNRQALALFFAPFEILPFDASAIWHYGEIRSDLEKRGTPIGSLDTMIAAHARSLGAVLVTNNVSEFSWVEGLRVENWAELSD